VRLGSNELHSRLIGIILVILVCFVYWPVHQAEFINFDDQLYVTENENLKNGLTHTTILNVFTSFYSANYHPFALLSHMLDYQFFGINAAGHHLTSLILHIGNSLLFFLVLRRMTGALWRSALVAFLFALHPLHVESVAWISERKDVLSTFFMLLALLIYASYTETLKVRDYILVLLLFFFGLLSKPMLVTLPFLLLLLDYWPLQRFSGKRFCRLEYKNGIIPSPKGVAMRLIIEKIPFLILSLVFSIVTFMAQHQAGAVSSVKTLPLGVRIGNALVAYSSYIVRTVWPINLGVFYPHPGNNISTLMAMVSAVMIMAVTLGVIHLRRQRPYLLVGWFWYIGMLVPVIGIVQVGMQAMADRYTYVPVVGLFIMLAWTVPDFRLQKKSRIITQVVLYSILAVLIVGATSKQASSWQNTMTVFSRADQVTERNILAKLLIAGQLAHKGRIDAAKDAFEEILRLSQNNVTVHYRYGLFLVSQGELQEGIEHLQEAQRLQPSSSMANNSIGLALMWQGKRDNANKYLREALRINPRNAETHYNLGLFWDIGKKYDESIRYYRRALELKPDYHQARLGLAADLALQGRVEEAKNHYAQVMKDNSHVVAETNFYFGRNLASQGKMDQAILQFRDGLKIEPRNIDARCWFARVLDSKGLLEEALSNYHEVLKIKSDHAAAHTGIGGIMERKGIPNDAMWHYNLALRSDPEFSDAHYHLGLMLERQGRWNEAAEHYQAILRLNSRKPEVHYHLAMVLLALKKSENASDHFEKALELDPGFQQAKTALNGINKNIKYRN